MSADIQRRQRIEADKQGTSSTGLKSTTTSTTEVSPTGTVNDIKPAPYAAGPGTGSASTSVGQSTGDLGEKAKQLFGQGLATVSVCPSRLPSSVPFPSALLRDALSLLLCSYSPSLRSELICRAHSTRSLLHSMRRLKPIPTPVS
jgi:hypothetical protein